MFGIEVNGKTVSITAVLTFLVLLGSSAGAVKILGWDSALPVTKQTLNETTRNLESNARSLENKVYRLAGNVEKDARAKNALWADFYRNQLYKNESAKAQWQSSNPGRLTPPIYDEQRTIIERTIQQLDEERKFLPDD